MPIIAAIVTDLERTAFNRPAHLGDALGAGSVLDHTLRRAARVQHVDRLVLVHPAGQDPRAAVAARTHEALAAHHKSLETLPIERGFDVPRARHWAAARKWAMTCWRGGIGGATAYDELLPAPPLLAAMEAHHASSALLLRAEWCAFDPGLADAQFAQHLENTEAYKLCFTQAPPGLSGLVASREVLAQAAEHHGAFGEALGYNPRRAALDPIGRDANIAVPAEVRDTFERFIHDTPRSIALLQAIAAQLGERFDNADAQAITETCRAVRARLDPRLPQEVTLELTPRRTAAGPLTPQHHVRFDRPDMDPALARRVLEQLGDDDAAGDVALRLGGLGDALLHPEWDELVRAAHEAGVLGIAVETDLLCDEATLDRLLTLPIDVVSVRLNADTAETYEKTMGVTDGFRRVAQNLHELMRRRNARWDAGDEPRLPWIVPHLTKTPETLKDMESFFDRWMMSEGQAVILPAQTGCGLMPDQSPMPMAPPKRGPCRQLGRRMTILSDGRVALCDQDWLGRASLGDAQAEPLLEIWRKVHEAERCHAEGRFDELSLCGVCEQWHRP